jgi:predicted RNA-binding Zn-ribbon protein involved in translation (DUF1610 family)
MSDLHTDGNEVAGVLAGVFAIDATAMLRRCGSCGDESPLAAHRAYRGAGVVLRCPACGDVALRVAELREELVLEWRGTYRVRAG